MSTTYFGDNSTGLIVATTLPDDGDVRDVASVNVSLQSILDSIASLASGTVDFVGVHRYKSGASLEIIGSNILLSASGGTGSFIEIGDNCGAAFATGSVLAATNSAWTFNAACTVSFAGAWTWAGASSIDMIGPSQFNIHTSADLHANSGAGIHIDSGGFLQIDGIGNVNATGELHVKSGGLATVEPGGVLRLEGPGLSGGLLNVFGGISVKATGAIAFETSSNLLFTGAFVAADSATQIGLTDTVVLGRVVCQAAIVKSGNGAWGGDRIGHIAPSSQTVQCAHFDKVSFNAAVTTSFTLTLADMPSPGDCHPVTIFVANSGGGGIGANVITLQDSAATVIGVISGAAFACFSVVLNYEPSGSPRWSVTGGGVL
jgi:hypothetical protein